jgi:subtilisin family serine protease
LLPSSSAAQIAPTEAEPVGAPARARVLAPGPRWTGRTIVHVTRDAAQHRLEMKALGALRRAQQGAALRERGAAYAAEMELLQEPIVALVRAHGGSVVGTSWLANSVAIEDASPVLIEALAHRGDVLVLQPDTWHEAQLEIATDAAHHDSDHANMLLSPGGIPTKGDGMTIAIVDSGIDANHAGSGRPHAAFYPDGDPTSATGPGLGGSRLLSAVNESVFAPFQPAEDICGHGTRMASIAAGAQFNLLPDVDDGPAPNAFLRAYKISDDSVVCLAATLSMDNAFEELLLDADVRVANMSYDGTNDPTLSPNKSIADAVLADVFVTLSAGNTGAGLGFAHGSYNALAVGASFVGAKQPLSIPGTVVSAIGPLNGRKYPQILAVGEALTCAKSDDESSSLDSYGTSGAAALVAGSAALVRQADPTLSALEVRALLLNTSEEVVLGNPKAAGYGYLRTDRAVEDALAGLVVSQVVSTGETRKHARFLLAGQEAAFTLAWLRETSTDTTIDDLDLRVRDPQGNLVAWSASTVDNTEQIRLTAVTAGVHTVEVVPILFDGDGTAEYALAGVDALAIDPGACSAGLPSVASQSPPVVPTLTQSFEWGAGVTNQVTLHGCNFAGVTQVTVGGTPYVPQVVDEHTLTFNLGVAPGVGSLPMTLVSGSGTAVDTLEVEAQNVLATTPTIDLGQMQLYVAGPPNHFYALAFSPQLIPTVVPGLLSVDIGDQGQSLYPIAFGNLNATNGVEFLQFTGIPGITGTQFHFQAVTLDDVTLTPPWISTNPSTVLFFL